jgi:hypothetical protein
MNYSLKQFIHEVIQESAYIIPNKWYHGSPYTGMVSAKDYVGRRIFLTDSLSVAKDYTRENPGLQAGTKPKGKEVTFSPTVYEFQLNFGVDEIFDMRKPEHQDLFRQLSKEVLQEDPEDGFRKSDVSAVHPAPGSSIYGIFPSFGIEIDLMKKLEKLGFLACFFAEGQQGASLAVRNPQYSLTLVNSISLQ